VKKVNGEEKINLRRTRERGRGKNVDQVETRERTVGSVSLTALRIPGADWKKRKV